MYGRIRQTHRGELGKQLHALDQLRHQQERVQVRAEQRECRRGRGVQEEPQGNLLEMRQERRGKSGEGEGFMFFFQFVCHFLKPFVCFRCSLLPQSSPFHHYFSRIFYDILSPPSFQIPLCHFSGSWRG